VGLFYPHEKRALKQVNPSNDRTQQ
jgi:hypothetical protein